MALAVSSAPALAAQSPLAAPLRSSNPPSWPIELRPLEAAQKDCDGSDCGRWSQLELTLQRAARWLTTFPGDLLRFDAAIGLSQARRSVDSDLLRRAFEQARTYAERDRDHPHQRFWRPEFAAPAKDTSQWTVPGPGGKRVNPNEVISEALYCRENGWRPETLRYVCGAMRDRGGYQTAHALWALVIVRGNGCLSAEQLARCMTALEKELARAQPATLKPLKTLDIDIYAERLLMLTLSGYGDGPVDDWAATLMKAQGSDGSWGVETPGEPRYFRYHTTNAAVWALSQWYRYRVEHPQGGR